MSGDFRIRYASFVLWVCFALSAPARGEHATPAATREQAPPDILDTGWREQYLKEALASRLETRKFFEALTKNPETKVVLFGEIHMFVDTANYARFMQLIHELSPDFDCIFLEERSDVQADLDAFVAGRLSHGDLLSRNRRSTLDHWFRWDMASVVKESRGAIKVFAIDRREDSLAKRNVLLADEMARLIQSGACKKAVYFGGVQHLLARSAPTPEDDWKREPVAPLGALLAQRKLGSASVMAQTIDRTFPYLRNDPLNWGPPGWNPTAAELGRTEFGLLPKKPAPAIWKSPPLDGRAPKKELATWDQLDGVIFIPQFR